MDNRILCKLFSNIYIKHCSTCKNRHIKLYIRDFDELENNLKKYLTEVMGYRINFDYSEYYREINIYFENIFLNATTNDYKDINKYIIKYGENFNKEINKRPLSSIFISTMKKVYSNDSCSSAIRNKGKTYSIERPYRKNEIGMPAIQIINIDSFEKTLEKFIESVLESDTYFNNFFEGMEYNEAVSYLFEWVIKNANIDDLFNIENYFRKYIDFVSDHTFDEFKKPVEIGTIFGDKIYAMLKRSNVNYETPYYFSFVMSDGERFCELPNIRFGIENTPNGKVAHILATQTSQDNPTFERFNELNKCFKSMIDSKKNFREFNPSHMISLIISFGLFKQYGINTVMAPDYLPFRLQRLILEGNKDVDELELLQYRLTNKNMYNYLRLCEHFDGIDVTSYPDLGNGISLKIGELVHSNNEFLQKLYNTGLSAGKDIKTKQK